MDYKGRTEVKAIATLGNKTTSSVNTNKGSDGDDISNLIRCLLLSKDNLAVAGNSGCSNRLDDDTIVCEILSRLPGKSLTRFKCVCKHWLYLIGQDQYFIDLHLTRSNKRTSLFYVISPLIKDQRDSKFTKGYDQFLLTADLSSEGIGRADVQTIRKTNMFRCNQILGSVNGLICFVDSNEYAVRIYNISTREASSWIHSKLLLNEKEKHPTIDTDRIHGTSYRFGYDPTTNEYKVLCIWRISVRKAGISLKGVNGVDVANGKITVCEILTLGHNNIWRRIDAVPPCYLGDNSPDVYANGSIYWCTNMWLNCPFSVVAFDFRTEKFRMIEIPKLIRDQPLDPGPHYRQYISLLELDGCLGIICRISDYVCKLWIFNDHHRQRESEKVGGEIWSEETIALPFPWNGTRRLYFSEVVGTYEIIIRDYQIVGGRINRIPLYSYHRKEKSFTEIKTDSSPFLDPHAYSIEKLTTYVENLVPVRQQRRHN